MNIYLIRHGKAEQSSEGKPHEERALTTNGIEIIRQSLNLWKEYVNTFDIILTSPLKRAKQTAQLVNDVFKSELGVVEEICLLNGGLTEDLISVSRGLNLNDIAMVGHQPDIGIHLAKMIGSNDTNYNIPASAIAKIYFKEKPTIGKGTLEFLLPPLNKKG